MPDEGRNFGSCKDGKCRVHVKPGDRITTPVEVGGTTLRIKAIEPGSVTFEQTGFGGGTFTATVFDTGSGTGLGGGDRYSIGFFEISEGQAILQIDA
ncbi:hypothetical protein [Amycolatopsis sp. NPDC059657]|uniref:hypothetical protein n=1 Tax=Amycolatopsis sp. NPDC059657 TaxID=3346899 RepID=UPI00366E1F30